MGWTGMLFRFETNTPCSPARQRRCGVELDCWALFELNLEGV